MQSRYFRYISIVYLAGDIVMLNISILIAYWLMVGTGVNSLFSKEYLIAIFISNILWIVVTYLLDTYHAILLEAENIITSTIKAMGVFLIVVSFLFFISNINYPRNHFLYNALLFLVFLALWRLILSMSITLYRKTGHNYKQYIIIGLNDAGKQLQRSFTKASYAGYRFMGFFDDKISINESDMVKGDSQMVFDYVLKNNIDEFFYSLSEEINYNYVNKLIDFADNNLVRVKLLTDFKFLPYKNFRIEFFDTLPILAIRAIPLDDLLNRKLKRAFDFTFSLLITIFILSWLCPLFGLFIKINSKGPVFFKQKRSGKDNKDFWCYKFRTMYVNNESDIQQASKNDSRITAIGKFLRKTNLDELPQFFNVLIGSMSIVGPRPHMLKHTEEYSQIIEKYLVRHFVKPGITGLAQIKGYRGETKDYLLMKSRIKIDIFYIENWSFLLDLKIIFVAILNMVRGDKNAY